MRVQATVHGAVSLVNAIATGKGATLGIDLKVCVTAEVEHGRGIILESKYKNVSSRLVEGTVRKMVSKKNLQKSRILLSVDTEIPAGYGLKSSSAISSAVAMACAKIFKPHATDRQILAAGIDASIETGVSITGAFDDACSCYYGGFNVTDNLRRRRVRSEKGPTDLSAIIFVPKNRKRGNIKNLRTMSAVFEKAWKLALKARYWDAMVVNGLATSVTLNSDPTTITDLMEKGAYGASVSGNGPAIAAITNRAYAKKIKKIFDGMEGYTITSGISNVKAEAHEV